MSEQARRPDVKRLGMPDTVTIANPNMERSYIVAYDSNPMEFKPLELYEVPAALAKTLIQNAIKQFADSKNAAVSEKKDYYKLVGSGKPEEKFFAESHFRPNGEFSTVTWKRPPLVDVNTVEGRRMLDEAMLEAQGAPAEVEKHSPATSVPLEKPSKDWLDEQLRDYLTAMSWTFSNKASKEALLSRAMEAFELQKKTLEQAGHTVEEF